MAQKVEVKQQPDGTWAVEIDGKVYGASKVRHAAERIRALALGEVNPVFIQKVGLPPAEAGLFSFRRFPDAGASGLEA